MNADFQYIIDLFRNLGKIAHFVKNYCFGKREKIFDWKIMG